MPAQIKKFKSIRTDLQKMCPVSKVRIYICLNRIVRPLLSKILFCLRAGNKHLEEVWNLAEDERFDNEEKSSCTENTIHGQWSFIWNLPEGKNLSAQHEWHELTLSGPNEHQQAKPAEAKIARAPEASIRRWDVSPLGIDERPLESLYIPMCCNI